MHRTRNIDLDSYLQEQTISQCHLSLAEAAHLGRGQCLPEDSMAQLDQWKGFAPETPAFHLSSFFLQLMVRLPSSTIGKYSAVCQGEGCRYFLDKSLVVTGHVGAFPPTTFHKTVYFPALLLWHNLVARVSTSPLLPLLSCILNILTIDVYFKMKSWLFWFKMFLNFQSSR